MHDAGVACGTVNSTTRGRRPAVNRLSSVWTTFADRAHARIHRLTHSSRLRVVECVGGCGGCYDQPCCRHHGREGTVVQNGARNYGRKRERRTRKKLRKKLSSHTCCAMCTHECPWRAGRCKAFAYLLHAMRCAEDEADDGHGAPVQHKAHLRAPAGRQHAAMPYMHHRTYSMVQQCNTKRTFSGAPIQMPNHPSPFPSPFLLWLRL